eukprot:TRINITY_DN3361_c0_g1_i3.p1 TRINITY_DN3361_c0_g1~~TRINITY_DN3361_c0_g1_i3.p1  ORF type:complete len:590 (-),score=136.55 TRINITY_DN3361_c0_g1_i3:440-2209(-)
MSTTQDVICTFKDDAPIRDFLFRRNVSLGGSQESEEQEEDKTTSTNADLKLFKYNEIQSALSQIIEREKLYDVTNPAIIICSKDLEKAFNVKAFHVSEFRDILFKQFQYIKQEPLEQEEECIVQPQDSAAVPLGGPTSSQSESPSKSISNVVEGSFNISLELREALCALPGFKKDQTLFQYNEILVLLSKYIILNKEKFFDPRNVKVAFIADDPLERAFKVKTFHRSQVTALLDREINRVSLGEADKKADDNVCQETSAKRKNDDAPGQDEEVRSVPKRVRRGSTYTVSVIGYESTDEETIYSAQGYETVAMTTEEGGEEEGSSSDDEDAMVYSAEYEIIEESESSPRASSDEDSELEDVVLRETVLDLMIQEEDELWADSESDEELPEKTYNNESSCDLKCCRCGGERKVILLYCEDCWRERKESCPMREKPRKKRQASKGTKAAPRPSFARSVSHTSSSSCEVPLPHYESQDSGVGSQESIFASGVDKSFPEASSDDSEGGASTNTTLSSNLYSSDPFSRRFAHSVRSTPSEGCSFCFRRPKNATLIHGNIGHTICCYPCAKRLWKNQRPCPICRRKIEKFVLNIEA